MKESETKRESEVLVENLRGQAERMKDVEDAKKAKISSPSGGYKRVEVSQRNTATDTPTKPIPLASH